MKPLNHAAAPDESPAEPADVKNCETTSLPWLRTWRQVYAFVFGCFILWVALLFVLTRIFS